MKNALWRGPAVNQPAGTFTDCVTNGGTREQTVRLKLAYARLFNSRTLARACGEWGLTPRECEVAVLACKGFSTVRTGACLGISEGTARTHRRRIFMRMGVHSVEQMICKLILSSGLLS